MINVHFHAGLPFVILVVVVVAPFAPAAASRPALFCLLTSKARASISLDRSISSKLLTRSFTLPPLLLLPSGMSTAADATGGGGDTGRRSTSRLGNRGSVGIRVRDGGCCRCTSSFGCAGRGAGLGCGVITGPRGFSNTSGGGRGRPGRAGLCVFRAGVFFLRVGRYEKKNPFIRLPTDGVWGTSCTEGSGVMCDVASVMSSSSDAGARVEGSPGVLDSEPSCWLSDLASSSKWE